METVFTSFTEKSYFHFTAKCNFNKFCFFPTRFLYFQGKFLIFVIVKFHFAFITDAKKFPLHFAIEQTGGKMVRNYLLNSRQTSLSSVNLASFGAARHSNFGMQIFHGTGIFYAKGVTTWRADGTSPFLWESNILKRV